MLTVYIVNAFTTLTPLSGNPAAVCILTHWLPDAAMQAIAAQHNLAETAFVVPSQNEHHYRIRWFTPTVEIDLCGHATLAAAHVLFNHFNVEATHVAFESASGPLMVSRLPRLTLNFPARPITQKPSSDALYKQAFNVTNTEILTNGKAVIIVMESEQQVTSCIPNYHAIAQLDENIVYITAPGMGVTDFICRVFAPKIGIPEDPVTGSAYTSLGPYWANKCSKNPLVAYQASPRGGNIHIEVKSDRVLIGGNAITVLIGEWQVEVDYEH